MNIHDVMLSRIKQIAKIPKVVQKIIQAPLAQLLDGLQAND
jgi:hypothetical protein